MSCSKPINFTDLNLDIFEHILKYLKFDELIRFERIDGHWRESIGGLLRRRKTADYHSCPGFELCKKGGHKFIAKDWIDSGKSHVIRRVQQTIEAKCPNLIFNINTYFGN